MFVKKNDFFLNLYEPTKLKNEKNKENNKYKIINLVINITTIIVIYIARNFYIHSLKGCKGNEYNCLIDIKYISEGIDYCIQSSICFLWVLILIQFKISSFYNIFLVIIILIELIIKDNGNTFEHHGSLNFAGLICILFFGELLILSILSIIYIMKNKIYKLILILIIFQTIIYIYIKFKNNYYCLNWEKGLNGTAINNDISIYPCSIKIPKKRCLIEILGPLFDFSRFINCKNRKEEEKHLLLDNSNLKDKRVKLIGYPITTYEKDKTKYAFYDKELFNYVTNHLIDMNDTVKLNKLNYREKPEIILDYTKNVFGELKIKINYKKRLSDKRKLLEKNKNSNNIIFIFLDNLSRVHFYRQYKKTSNFLKKFFKYEGFKVKHKNNVYHAFEFLKYHKLKKYTLNNIIPMFSGVNFHPKNKMISILDEFKKNGYITCNVQDICHKELAKIGPLKGYRYIEFDHEFSAPGCDPNIYNEGYGFFIGNNGVLRKCLYGKEIFEHCVNYAKQFWEVYKDNKKFLRISNSYAHEYSGEKSKYADDSLYNFLHELFSTNHVENTSIFITADHGLVGLFGIYRLLNAKDYESETALPIFILIVPDQKNSSYNKQYSEIAKNQNN